MNGNTTTNSHLSLGEGDAIDTDRGFRGAMVLGFGTRVGDRVVTYNASHVVTALHTLPAQPLEGRLEFIAHDVERPHYQVRIQDEEMKFLRQCEERGIAPHHLVEFHYDHNREMFLPAVSQFKFEPSPRVTQEFALRMIRKGGKPQFIAYMIGDCNYGKFQAILPEILEDGYLPRSGRLVLSTATQGCCAEKKTLPGTVLEFSRHSGYTSLRVETVNGPKNELLQKWLEEVSV
jgi:hypothetical protein